MKPMLLTSANEIPVGNEWIYEVKYDGFRCILIWDDKSPTFISRNGNDLTHLFPEIIQFYTSIYEQVAPFLPITADGELVHLINEFKSDFSIVQSRGRMRNEKVISKHVEKHPCSYIMFDLLRIKGKDLTNSPLSTRKAELHRIFQSTGNIQVIAVYEDADLVWNIAQVNNSEGIVAKRKTSDWMGGQRTNQWLKIKNWKYVTVVLTKYNQENGYFHGSVYQMESLVEITVFRYGFTDEERQTLVDFIQKKGTKVAQDNWELSPFICVDVACIDFDGKKLREPRFHKFNFDINPGQVNWREMQKQLHPIPPSIQITHPDKPIWPAIDIKKDDYLYYLQQIAPHLLPFLHDRHLTAIRFPHGVPGESFYQKNAPDYTPDFIATKQHEDIRYIVCNDLQSLLWLGNQLALEFHVPFQTTNTNCPTEVVFDLDPPSVSAFSLAIEAALNMKAIFDQFNLQSFVKTSGGKGIQVYIPLPKDVFTYEDTRIFTEFVCRFLCEQKPQSFTIERLKKNRHNKLYLDYVQHAEGKTIIAPYSPRGNEQGLIATPLYWEEVTDKLRPTLFPMPVVLERIKNQGDPFKNFREIGEEQKFEVVLNQLRDLMK
ncbi:DNA ligase D [Sporosarcina sp. Marseille-Q4063]|uniref:DNA ligase D n=1 Tax=Sporosarcina sp. Marseille-Q4063 TaxID=2810514 RepID=UPI001BB07C92|nr:DNA ligase D [Sporosarcina sp. Marseille-Q4063]QUW23680.1 DNA ligase D [Sporosarcina sp. Marseille-Q4063]